MDLSKLPTCDFGHSFEAFGHLTAIEPAVSVNEVVNGNNIVFSFEKFNNAMTSDVARAASHENTWLGRHVAARKGN